MVATATPPPEGNYGTPEISGNKAHVFLELGDHLGSTNIVIDRATSELVERGTYQAYGAAESDYRPDRWENFREDYKFTGKEEDVTVGLHYFGKRFLSTHLQRWVSADPLTVHAPGEGDLNVYAYVRGRALQATDPMGLEDVVYAEDDNGTFEATSSHPSDPSQGCNQGRCGTAIASVPDRVKTRSGEVASKKGGGPDAGVGTAARSPVGRQVLIPGSSDITWRIGGEGNDEFLLYKDGSETKGQVSLTPTWLSYSIPEGRLTVSPSADSSYTIDATSGAGDCMNNATCKNRFETGPIFPGTYTLHSNEVSDVSLPRAIGRWVKDGDYGSFSVAAHPDGWTAEAIEASGRTGQFRVHGGNWKGSAGCIDCGGGFTGSATTDRLVKDLKNAPTGRVRLLVWE